MKKEAKKPAGKSHLKRLFWCSCAALALMALPVFRSLNSGQKQLTNEEVVQNWFDNTRKGRNVKKPEPVTIKREPDIIRLREEQIKEVDKTDDGWQVITNENRVVWVPKTDAGKK